MEPPTIPCDDKAARRAARAQAMCLGGNVVTTDVRRTRALEMLQLSAQNEVIEELRVRAPRAPSQPAAWMCAPLWPLAARPRAGPSPAGPCCLRRLPTATLAPVWCPPA